MNINFSGCHLFSYTAILHPLNRPEHAFNHSVQYNVTQNLEGLSPSARTYITATHNPLEKRNEVGEMKRILNEKVTWLALKAVTDGDIYAHLRTTS